MGAILGFLYNFLTMPVGLPINPFYSWVIMAVIGVMAFWIAYGLLNQYLIWGIKACVRLIEVFLIYSRGTEKNLQKPLDKFQ